MADRSYPVYQGFLVPLPLDAGQFAADRLLAAGALAGDCSYTEASPRPDLPEADNANAGQLALVAGGDLTTIDGAFDLLLQVGGLAGGGAGLCWRRAGDTPYHGRNLHQLIVGWDSLVWTAGGGGDVVKTTTLTGACTMPNGRALACYDFRQTLLGVDTWGVRVVYWDDDAVDYAHTDVYTTGDNPGHLFYSCLWVAEGAVYLGHLTKDLAGVHSKYQLRVYRSDDDGRTWTLASRSAALAGETLHSLGEDRMSVAYRDGQAVLVQRLNDSVGNKDDIYQWASPDVGLHFRPVGDPGNDALFGIACTVLATDEGFELLYLPTESTDDEGATMYFAPGVRRIATAFEPFAEATLRAAVIVNESTTLPVSGTWRTVSGNEVTAGELAAVLDHDGRRWLYGINLDSGGAEAGLVLSSRDGSTWERHWSIGTDHPPGSWCRTGDALTRPTHFCAAAERGRMGIFHNHLADPGTQDNSLSVLWVGGWDTATPPAEQLFETWQLSWAYDWLPYDRPQEVAAWTWSTSGTASFTLTVGRGELVTTAGTGVASLVPTAGVAEGFLAEIDMEMSSGGAVASLKVGARLRVEDGSDSYEAQIRVDDAGHIRVWDPNAAGGIGAAVGNLSVTTTARFSVRVAICQDGVRTWYRAHDPTATAYTWTDGPSGALVSGTPGSGNIFAWGCHSSDTSESYWYRVHFGEGSTAPVEMVSAWSNPGALRAGDIAATPYPLDAGTTIAAASGLGQMGDAWTLGATADYALKNMLAEVEASPRRPWRSTSTDEQLIVWELGDASTRPMRDGLGLALYGINFRTAYLEGSDDGASWTSLVTLDAAKTWTADGAVSRTSLRYLRHGRTLSPDAGTAGGDTPWLNSQDVAGGLALFGGVKPRRIGRCSSGRWTSASVTDTQAPCRVELQGLDGTEGTSGTNLTLCAPRVAGFVQLASTNYRYIRLRIPSQSTAEGYFEIGTALLGHIVALGQRVAKGSRTAWVDGAVLDRQDDGQALVYAAAPGHRELELGWAEGVDTRGLWGADPDVDYLRASSTSGAPPVATPQSVPMDVEGLWLDLGGAAGVAAWCRWLPQGSPDAIVLSDFERFPVLCRLTGPPDREALFGDEADDEAIRVSIVATEEV